MNKIKQISAREILDSKGIPTIETSVLLENNFSGTASCPSGTSVGKYEAYELRDNDPNRYNGLGVTKAVANVNNTIAHRLIGTDISNQGEIDKIMIDLDASPNKQNLGANAILSVSIACLKASANSLNYPLYKYIREILVKDKTKPKIPIPMFNILNGGKHAGDNIEIQEFLLIPASFKEYHDSLMNAAGVYSNLKKILEQNYLSVPMGSEGGYAPKLAMNQDALSLISQSIESSKLRLGYDIYLGIDAASDNFFIDQKYKIKDRPSPLSSGDLIAYYLELVSKYHIIYLEDPLSQDDLTGWSEANKQLGQLTTIVGDDLTATNPTRLHLALSKQAIGGIIIKPNQIGTISETLDVVDMARKANIKIIVSHRSKETDDDFIADFAVGVGSDYVKFGAPAEGERVAKYNRLLQIEQDLLQTQPQA